MNAERRNRRYELYFHILLAFYSIAAIGHQILSHDEIGLLGNNVFLFLSVCTLSLSLLIFGFKFGETAAQHRGCYLTLQGLRYQFLSIESLNETYVNTIGSLPNHTTRDFHKLAINNIFRTSQRLLTSEGKNYQFSLWMRAKFALTELILLIIAVLAFAPPILVLLEPFVSTWHCM